jgi:TPR repeat protein
MMREFTAILARAIIGALIALLIPNTAAFAAAPPVDLPIPRIYRFEPGPPDPNKPADRRAREEAQANAYEATCNTGSGTAKWDGCAELGRAYHFGEGRPQNRPVAELLYRRACHAGSGAGCSGVGTLLQGIDNDAEARLAFEFFARGCRLGMLNGCDGQADLLAESRLGEPDPQAAEALRRATCERGGQAACRALAGLLLRSDRSPAEGDEGRALLDRQCRAGDADACRDAAAHWRSLIAVDAEPRYAEYHRLACVAGSATSCSERGFAAMRAAFVIDDAVRTTALVWFDRACQFDTGTCDYAAQVRADPQLSQQCDAGDQAACFKLGEMLANLFSPVADQARALQVLGKTCEAGNDAACLPAADLMFAQWRGNDSAEAARAEAYLDQSCASGERTACYRLAVALADGDRLVQDQPRAAVLFAEMCETDDANACSELVDLARIVPSAPLGLARADFGPELSPEEAAADDKERRLKAEEEGRLITRELFRKACTTTTVVFEGQSYNDKLCRAVVRVKRGFKVNPGAAPWQALFWRPAKQPGPSGRALNIKDRVLCGGSLIRTGWVLTAAHCVNDSEMGNVSIKTGGHRIRLGLTNALGDEGFSYPITAVHRHPDYDRRVLAFDIALVQYDHTKGTSGSNAAAPAFIRLDPVPLSSRKIEAIPRVSTYGWGLTDVTGGTIPDQLRGARMKLRDRDACTETIKFKDAKRRDSVLCADELAGKEGGQACSGDSGGPLITYSDPDKIPTLIGVVSGGKDCGKDGDPSRYIRVAHPLVQEWLKATLPAARPR